MPINVSWINPEKTILCYDFTGDWTWDEYWVAADHATELYDSVSHVVYTIADLSQSGEMPANALANIRNARRSSPKHQALMVVIGDDVFLKRVVEMANSVSPFAATMKFTDSRETALQMIEVHMQQRGLVQSKPK